MDLFEYNRGKDWTYSGYDLIDIWLREDGPVGFVLGAFICVVLVIFFVLTPFESFPAAFIIGGILGVFYPITMGGVWTIIILPTMLKRLAMQYVFKLEWRKQ